MLGRVPNAVALVHAAEYHIAGSVELRGSILIPVYSRQWPTVVHDWPKELLVKFHEYVATRAEQPLPVLHDTGCQDKLQDQVHQQPLLVCSHICRQCGLVDLVSSAAIFNHNHSLVAAAIVHMRIPREGQETKSVYNLDACETQRSMEEEKQLVWKSDQLLQQRLKGTEWHQRFKEKIHRKNTQLVHGQSKFWW